MLRLKAYIVIYIWQMREKTNQYYIIKYNMMSKLYDFNGYIYQKQYLSFAPALVLDHI